MKGRKLAPSRRPSRREERRSSRRRSTPSSPSIEEPHPRRASPRKQAAPPPIAEEAAAPAPEDKSARNPRPARRASAALRLDHGCGRALHARGADLRRRDGAAHRRGDRQAVARDRSRARRSIPKAASPTRSRRATPSAASCSRGRSTSRRDGDRRTVRPADLRSRSQLPRLSRLRRLPRRRARAAAPARRCQRRPSKQRLLRPRQQSRRRSRASAAHRRAGREERRAVPRRRAGEAPGADAGRALGLPRDRRDLEERSPASATAAPARLRRRPSPQSRARRRRPTPNRLPSAFATAAISAAPAQKNAEAQLVVLERLPVGVLIHRADALLYANRAFLEWTGYADLAAVSAAGGLERLVVEPQRRRARPRQRHRQDLHDRDAHRRHAHLRGPALFRAVAGRERADAGADPHRGRRPAARPPSSRCAPPRPRSRELQLDPRHRDRRRRSWSTATG